MNSSAGFSTPQFDSTVVTPTEQNPAIGAPVKSIDRAAVSFERLCMGQTFNQTCICLELIPQSCVLMAIHRSQGLWYVALHTCAHPVLLTDQVQAT